MAEQSKSPPEPRSYRHKIGDVELTALSDGGMNYPAPMIFGNVPPQEAARLKLPEKQVFVPYTILLLETGGNLLLMDVGAGTFSDEADAVFPGLDHATSRTNLVLPTLKAAGIDAGDIGTVLITHAHPDHVGGLLDAAGNLVFSEARYYVGRKEKEYWLAADASAIEAEALREHMTMLVTAARKALGAIEDKTVLVDEGEELLPGVRVEAGYGHTLWHLTVRISAGAQTIYNISDVVVHPLYVEHPEWAPALDMDADLADKTRRSFYARAASENALVFGHHMGPFPNFGRIAKRGKVHVWEPL
jgi:glyoxylase-like metal-dependent hydrolase (beta-lactamase superfamily II)